MSKIDKMSIQGIRSFDHKQRMTIQFYTPLTLIVGYNGSGKTTIVECLKYATTGELPPNSKGGAFIHDPKLAGEKEVLAQTKLQFYSTDRQRMVVMRSLQLSVKKNSRSMKTLEGNLVKDNHGERMSVSTRVAELDKLIPEYLGVPPAILDNVIFCHQDESLWPMSEPSVLKKKFDEIFDAQKFTKAIDNIKQLRKKQNEELGKLKIHEQHAKEEKDRASGIERRCHKIRDEIEGIRQEAEQLGEAMARSAEAADKAWTQSERYSEVLGQLKYKKDEVAGRRRTIEDLEQHLKETDETDDWLEATLAQYDKQLDKYRDQEETKKETYRELRQQVEESRAQLNNKQRRFGELENDKAQYERNLVRRQNLVKDVAQQHSIRGYDDSIDEDMFTEFMRRLRKLVKDQTNQLGKVKSDGATELREAQTSRNQLDRREEALQHEKQSSRQRAVANEQDMSTIQVQADRIAVDEGTKAVIDSKIEETNSKLQKIKEAAEQADREAQITEAQAKLRAYEQESSRLNEELLEVSKKANEVAQLDHLKQELKARHRSLETVTGAHRKRIEKLLGNEWDASTINDHFQKVLTERSEAVQAAERKRDASARELEQLEFRLKTAKTALKDKRAEAAKAESAVKDAIDEDPDEYEDILAERQKSVEIMKSDVGQFTGLEEFLTKCLTVASEKESCRLCHRPFRNKDDLSKHKRSLETLIQTTRTQYDPQEIKVADEQLEATRAAGTHYTVWKRLSTTEIPALEQQESSLNADRQSLIGRVEQHDEVVSQKAEAKRDVESLAKTVSTIDKYDSDIKDLDKQVQELSAQQSQSQHGRTRTLEDIRDDISSVTQKATAINQLVAKLSKEREQARSETAELELQLSRLRNDLNSASFQMERKASLISRIEELKTANQKLREAVSKADKDLENLSPQIAQAKARYDDIYERIQNREAEIQRSITKLSDSVHQLDMANDLIRSYIERDGPRELARAQRDIKSTEAEISRLESEQGSITAEINRISTQLHDSESTRRQYSDNLRYRQEKKALAIVQSEIEELSSQNAEVDRDRFQRESKRATDEHHKLSSQRQSLMGEMKSKDSHLAELLNDWNLIKDASERYRESHIKVETTKAAVEDLGRYGSALDKAVMTYHSAKMEEINRIIEELWRDTYQGTDLDTILIRSDNENAKGNRSYNYRVCMVKQDVEMDMRGRCSAGQKVLACIIIRLALAECFGVNCGVMALDEPTTNLDRDNIRALALSLHNIIKQRQQQSNFQLIVITHDEEFLRHMKCSEFADYYYRVSRTREQKSCIELQSIAEVL